jgi:ubiquinone biosynthesis protein
LRHFLTMVVIDTIVIAVVFWFLGLFDFPVYDPVTGTVTNGPIISIVDAPPLAIPGFALVFALVTAVVTPLILLLTGSLLVRSLGVFLVVVNVLQFWIATIVSPYEWQIAQPTWFWIIVTAVLIWLLTTAVEILVGVDRPAVAVSDRQKAIWRILDQVPIGGRTSIIRNLRLQQVYNEFFAFGVDIALHGSVISRIRSVTQRVTGEADARYQALSTPGKFRVTLEKLGPAYVKLGQMISSRSEALPVEWQEELDKLQNTVGPFPYEQVREIVISQLGKPPEELYASFDETPLAAASLAQVHRATLHDGREVVVKVQRPDVQRMVEADLAVMRELAGTAQKRFSFAARLDAQGLVEEFADGVVKELDYRIETYHARRLASNMKGIPQAHVPYIEGSLSARRVITMEFVRGVKITAVDEMDAAGIDREAISRAFMKAIIKQILIDGFFHADPHPGNILVDLRTGEIIFLDLGLVGQLTRDQRFDLIDLMWSVVQKDSAAIASVAIRISDQVGEVDEQQLRDAIDQITYQYLIYGGEGGGDFGGAVSSIIGSLYDNGLRLNQDFTLALKAIVQVEEITRTLDPGFELLKTALTEVQFLMAAEFTTDRIVDAIKGQVVASGKEVIRRLPSLQGATLSWLDQYQKGKLSVSIETKDLSDKIGEVGNIGRQLAVGMILTGLLLAMALMFAVLLAVPAAGQQFPLLPTFVTVGMVVSVFFAIWVVFRLVRGEPAKGRRRP